MYSLSAECCHLKFSAHLAQHLAAQRATGLLSSTFSKCPALLYCPLPFDLPKQEIVYNQEKVPKLSESQTPDLLFFLGSRFVGNGKETIGKRVDTVELPPLPPLKLSDYYSLKLSEGWFIDSLI